MRIRILTPAQRLFASGWASPRRLGRRLARKVLERWPSRIFPRGDKWYGRVSIYTDLALQRYLNRQHGCVVIGTNPGLNIALARLAPPTTITIGQEHLHLARRARSRHRLIAAHYPALDAVVTLTTADAQDYRSLLPGTLVEAIPNAVPEFAGANQPPAPRSPTIVAAGRLTRQKGFDQLIHAWATVSRDHPHWRLNIYGSGPEQSHLQTLIDNLDLTQCTSLVGHVDDLGAVLRSAGMFVLSSRYEGFPMVLLEAMSCAAPIVAFDCPTGPADLIRDGINGRLVPAGNVAELATAISSLVDHPTRRHRLGSAARVFSKDYDRDLIASRWEELFHRLQLARSAALE